MRVTVLYCPFCERHTRCARTAASKDLGYAGETSSRHRYFEDQPDIKWYRRVRKCLDCTSTFETSELRVQFVRELRTCRMELAACRTELDRYKEQVRSAAEKLKEVTTTLEGLERSLSERPGC